MKLQYKGKVLDGVSVWYHQNGNKSIEFRYKKGELEGTAKRWYYDGTLQSIDNYADNHKQGLSVLYNEKGIKILESQYSMDTLDGPYHEHHPSGQLMIEGSYDKGFFHGEWKYFNQKGLQIGKGSFTHGTGIQEAWYENGKTMRIVHYVNGKKNGKETRWDQNGNITEVITYKEDQVTESLSY